MRKIVLLGLFALTTLVSFGQAEKNLAWFDQSTYEAYQRHDWDKVITLGKEALKAGYDYFYLRLRLGIAYFEKAKYRAAISHFEKALKFNNSDPLTVEYLYYAYRFSGRDYDAGLVYSQNKAQARARQISKPNGFVNGFYTETGLKMISPQSPDFSALKYFHFGLEQRLGSRLNLYHGYTRLGQNIYDNNLAGSGSGWYTNNRRKYVQNEYYGRLKIPLVKGLQLTGALRWQAISDTLSYQNNTFLAGFNSNFKPFDVFASYGWAAVKSRQHQQFSVGATFYPGMNLNFYLQTIYTYHFTDGFSNNIFSGKIGLKTGQNTWFELYSSFGDLRNVQEMDGFYFFNIPDKLRNRTGITSIFLLGSKARLLVGYAAENLTQVSTEINYRQHYIFLGLQVQFKN